MCAINGITWEDTYLMQQMNAVTLHRGPDGSKVQGLHGATFGHNRLSIIDPTPRSDQPMQTPDGRYTLTFNGEIYNFKDIRKELSGSYDFKTESDTEVILAGFQRWGKEVFNRLNGMYALAVHDRETETVTLARDPMGIKPLYITKTKKGYAFSSEIKGLLEIGIARTLQRDAFDAYMRTLYVPAPLTLFEGVEKFPAASVGEIKNGTITYSSIEFKALNTPLAHGDAAGLCEAVHSAVKRQLISDRALGVYLSGGIDSSSVLAAATEAGGNMDTYSIGFELDEGEEPAKFNADSILARRIAKHFGARHHEFTIAPNEVLSLFERAVYSLDEPVGNATIAAQISLSEKARESVAVALTGDGGDELFGGYPRYLLSRRMDGFQKIVPRFISDSIPFSSIKKLGLRDLKDRFELFHYQKDHQLENILSELPKFSFEFSGWSNIMEVDRDTWLVDEALLRSDKLGMAHGLETRPPLLDLELVHQVKDVPFKKQVSLFDTKILLKRAFNTDLPEWVLNQPKRGWFSPGAKWLRHSDLTEEISHILSPGYASQTDHLFKWDGIQKMYQDHKEKHAYHATPLLSVIMFQLWSKQFKISV